MTTFKKVTLPYEDFANLYGALQIIGTRQDLDIGYAIAKNLKLGEKLYIAYRDEMFQIQQKHAVMAKGKIVTDHETGEPQYLDKALADEAFKECNAKEVSFEVYEILKDNYADNAFSKLTPMMIVPLLDIIIIEKSQVKFESVVGKA